MSGQALISMPDVKLPAFPLTREAIIARDAALLAAAIIGKVENARENELAVKAMSCLKQFKLDMEKTRKAIKEPFLEAGRAIDRIAAQQVLEVDQEFGRLSALTSQFQIAERERMREEEELRRRELERIEAEKLAELRRIAEEQARVEREAKAAQEAKDRAALEAKLAAERVAKEAQSFAEQVAAKEAIEKAERLQQAAKAEADRQSEACKQAQLAADAARAKVEESAEERVRIESAPIVATRSAGQIVKTDWDIQVVNPYDLAKFHPDCVDITPKLSAIKAILNEGRDVKGIKAAKKLTATVRASRQDTLIDV